MPPHVDEVPRSWRDDVPEHCPIPNKYMPHWQKRNLFDHYTQDWFYGINDSAMRQFCLQCKALMQLYPPKALRPDEPDVDDDVPTLPANVVPEPPPRYMTEADRILDRSYRERASPQHTAQFRGDAEAFHSFMRRNKVHEMMRRNTKEFVEWIMKALKTRPSSDNQEYFEIMQTIDDTGYLEILSAIVQEATVDESMTQYFANEVLAGIDAEYARVLDCEDSMDDSLNHFLVNNIDTYNASISENGPTLMQTQNLYGRC